MTRLTRFSWFVLVFNVVVILWGALVRATGSGAGCGSHWPSCNGEALPTNPTIETLIEFTHRMTSGVALVLVVVLFLWTRRAFKPGSLARRGAAFSLLFIGIEALIGAGLVLFGLVADNDSLLRAVTISIHLANTFLLLGSLTLTAVWAGGGGKLKLRGQGLLTGLFILGGLALIFLGMTGAVTALGDTLFPAESLRQGIEQDFSGTAHFLIQLRVVHPITAVLTSAYLLALTLVTVLQRPIPAVRRVSGMLMLLIFIQLIAGIVNVVLLAPVWMQIVHLLLADLVWIVFVVLTAAAFSEAAIRSNVQRQVHPEHTPTAA